MIGSGPGRAGGGPRAGRQGLPGHGLRQPPLRRRARCSSASRPSASRARRSRWTSAWSSAWGSTFHYNTTVGKDVLFEDLQRDYDAIAICAGAMDAVGLDIAGSDLDGRPVRRRLHEEGEPRRAARGGPQRRRHRRRLHGDGLLADQPPPRRRERDDRLPADPLRARRRRGGAGRDRARGRPDGVPRQPDRARRRGREAHRREVHPQQARRAGRIRPPLAGPDPRVGVRGPGGHGHPGGLPGGRPQLPAGRVELRGRAAAGSGWTPPPTPRTSAASSPAATS